MLDVGSGYGQSLGGVLQSATALHPLEIFRCEYREDVQCQRTTRERRYDVLLVTADYVNAELKTIVQDAKGYAQNTPLLALVAACSPHEAIDLFKQGASDVLSLPVTAAEITPPLLRILQQKSLDAIAHQVKVGAGLSRLIGSAPAFLEEVRKVSLAAKCDVT